MFDIIRRVLNIRSAISQKKNIMSLFHSNAMGSRNTVGKSFEIYSFKSKLEDMIGYSMCNLCFQFLHIDDLIVLM